MPHCDGARGCNQAGEGSSAHLMRSRPIIFYVAGIALFSSMDAVMKQMLLTHEALEVTTWRYGWAVIFTFLLWWRDGAHPITWEILPVHMLRGGILATSSFLFFWGVARLPLAEVITLAFIAPLLIPPLAALILKERMQGGSVMAGLVGFVGVIIAVGFDPSSLSPARLLAVGAVLASAVTYALSIIFMRMRAARDGASVVSLLGALIPGLVLSVPLVLTQPQQLLPTGSIWWLAMAAGALGAIALQLLARAYAQAEAQKLAPFEYTALAWASLFGWMFFDEAVELRTWAGALVIAGACIWQVRMSTNARKAPASG